MINIIACVGKNLELGKNNDLCFKSKQDLKHFSSKTKDGIVVCGLNTLASFKDGVPLKQRATILLCPEEANRPDCICYNNFEKLLHDIQILSKVTTIWIIGGASIYRQFLPFCDNLILTEVDAADSDATVFFPEFHDQFISNIEDNVSFTEDGLTYTIINYSRKEEFI